VTDGGTDGIAMAYTHYSIYAVARKKTKEKNNISPKTRESHQNKPKNMQPTTDEKIPQVSIKTSPMLREKRKVGNTGLWILHKCELRIEITHNVMYCTVGDPLVTGAAAYCPRKI